VCLSGGLIAGAPVDGYGRIVDIAHRCGVPVAIDSHGPPLLEALAAGSELVKLNAGEASEALQPGGTVPRRPPRATRCAGPPAPPRRSTGAFPRTGLPW
jgi:hypothetical protein